MINEGFSNLLLNALGMVEYDAQNKYESMQETGDNFQESGELKTISNIVKVNL